jgi:hypothetical protein
MPMDWGLARDYAARDVHSEETPVTEAEWLAATEPQAMLVHLGDRTSDRKLQLFACACCRRVWPLLIDYRSRTGVEAAERYADGEASFAALMAAFDEAMQATRDVSDANGAAGPGAPSLGAVRAAEAAEMSAYQCRDGGVWVASDGYAPWSAAVEAAASGAGAGAPDTEASHRASLLRCIMGLPFGRPATAVDLAWLSCEGSLVRRLARVAYEERRLPEGTLDPVLLAVLADALEDAGWTDAELLGHLRGPGPHVLGCWALDLILGKS